MTNNKLTNRRTISTRIADILVADSVPLSDAWKRLIDDAGEMELETQELRRILSGLPQYAIDGGWSAAGISAYAVRLESELQELRRNYLVLRGEIEDVQSQLYEAESQANEYASELQERRKADSQ